MVPMEVQGQLVTRLSFNNIDSDPRYRNIKIGEYRFCTTLSSPRGVYFDQAIVGAVILSSLGTQ